MIPAILDCESVYSTQESLSALLRVSPEELRRHIDYFVANPLEVRRNQFEDRWLPMLSRITGDAHMDEGAGQTMWFHATRVDDFDAFRRGLRTVREQIEHTWMFLHTLVCDIVSEEKWRCFRRQVERDNYGHPREVHRAWMSDGGPCAFLFAETALNPVGTGNHDYLAISELVDFIAVSFERVYSVNLRERHRAATKPCLVKFFTPGVKTVHIGAAIDYLVCTQAGHDRCCLDPCFSAFGVSIPTDQVSKVIPIHETRRRGFEGTPGYRAAPAEFHLHNGRL